jgi:hypothetical protein
MIIPTRYPVRARRSCREEPFSSSSPIPDRRIKSRARDAPFAASGDDAGSGEAGSGSGKGGGGSGRVVWVERRKPGVLESGGEGHSITRVFGEEGLTEVLGYRGSREGGRKQ